jgi:hypothetical protein
MFSMDMALLSSIGVFKEFRGRGIGNVIYQACDHILIFGLLKSKPDFEGETYPIPYIHVECSAPETIHLCEKYGYEKLAAFIYSMKTVILEGYGQGPIETIIPGLQSDTVKARFKGEEPSIVYFVKEGSSFD